MNYCTGDGADLYYEQAGEGEPIIALHGFSLNGLYWELSGIKQTLSAKYRFISVDMRGHGRTITHGEPAGYDVATIADDIQIIADHLGIERFHLMGHSTGGMAAIRYAITSSDRLSSLILQNTSSATALISRDSGKQKKAMDIFAQMFEKNLWDAITRQIKNNPFPFHIGFDKNPEPDRLWGHMSKIFQMNSRMQMALFARSFYTDPEHYREELNTIPCPTLVLCSEYDPLMKEPGEILAREIPNARSVYLDGIGHMSALEAPERVLQAIGSFLDTVAFVC